MDVGSYVGGDTAVGTGSDAEPDVVTDQVNGWSADLVLYEGGAFAQLSSATWVENNADGRTLYEEVNRDEWTVYLIDSDTRRNANMDLYEGEIRAGVSSLYSATGTAYDLIDAFATTRFVLRSDELPDATVIQVGFTCWEARSMNAASILLEESTRDPLHDSPDSEWIWLGPHPPVVGRPAEPNH